MGESTNIAREERIAEREREMRRWIKGIFSKGHQQVRVKANLLSEESARSIAARLGKSCALVRSRAVGDEYLFSNSGYGPRFDELDESGRNYEVRMLHRAPY